MSIKAGSKRAFGRPKEPPRPGLGTTADLLRAIGVGRASLDHAWHNGHITPALTDDDGRVWWDVARAAADYNSRVRRRTDTLGNATLPGSAAVKAALAAETGDESPESIGRTERERRPGESYQDARTRLARADADKRELEVRQKRDELVEAAAVTRALESIAIGLRDSLSSIGARIAGQLAVESDARRCREVVDDEVRRCLASASKAIRESVPGSSHE